MFSMFHHLLACELGCFVTPIRSTFNLLKSRQTISLVIDRDAVHTTGSKTILGNNNRREEADKASKHWFTLPKSNPTRTVSTKILKGTYQHRLNIKQGHLHFGMLPFSYRHWFCFVFYFYKFKTSECTSAAMCVGSNCSYQSKVSSSCQCSTL